MRRGTSTITSHEPWKKLLLPTTSATTAVVSAPSPLIARPRRQPGSLPAPPAHEHAGLGQGEGDEHAKRVERDEAGDAGLEADEKADRHERERHDPGREGEPFAAEGELARQEPVARQERGKAREVGEGRVRCEHEDERGGHLGHHQDRALAGQASDEEAQHRVLMAPIGLDPEPGEEKGESDEQGGEHDGGPGQRRPGVLPLRRLEGGHAVADRLHAGQRHGALAERAQDQEESERLRPLLDRLPPGRRRERGDVAKRHACDPVADDREHDDDVRVRRDHEDRPGLANAAKVAEHDQQHQRHAHPDASVVELRKDRVSAATPADTDTATVTT